MLFIGLVGLLFKHIHEKVDFTDNSTSAAASTDTTANSSKNWSEVFATYIRNNDVTLMENCAKCLKEFEEELIVCEDWLEIFDVLSKYNLSLRKLYQFRLTNK